MKTGNIKYPALGLGQHLHNYISGKEINKRKEILFFTQNFERDYHVTSHVNVTVDAFNWVPVGEVKHSLQILRRRAVWEIFFVRLKIKNTQVFAYYPPFCFLAHQQVF